MFFTHLIFPFYELVIREANDRMNDLPSKNKPIDS